MNRPVAIILSILFLMILLGSLGVFIYNVFNNTAYPDESEDLVDTSSFAAVPITDPKDLTQLTLQDMQQDMTELPGGYLLSPPRTRFQCLLPQLAG
jgi:hypothetical protein